MNMVVHNTTWLPGHFHLTVGSATTLTFFGILYWLLPKLTGKKLFTKTLALAQAWTWFLGMLLANGYHLLGLHHGAASPMLGDAPYRAVEWTPYLIETVVGGRSFSSAPRSFLSWPRPLAAQPALGATCRNACGIEIRCTPARRPNGSIHGPWLAGAIALILPCQLWANSLSTRARHAVDSVCAESVVT